MKLGLAFIAIAFFKISQIAHIFWSAVTAWRGKEKDEYDPQKDFI